MAKSSWNPEEADESSVQRGTGAATLDRDRVAQRAYELYLSRGCAEGRELDDWLCAERELSGERPGDDRSVADERDSEER